MSAGKETGPPIAFPRLGTKTDRAGGAIGASKRGQMSSNKTPPHAETILVAEHDQTLRQLVCRVLLLAGYRTVQACGAREALGTAARHESEIDLLLTEVALPGLYGWQLAELLKLDYPKLKVMFIADGIDDEGITIAGVSEPVLFKKSFRCDDLLQAVRNALGGREVARR